MKNRSSVKNVEIMRWEMPKIYLALNSVGLNAIQLSFASNQLHQLPMSRFIWISHEKA
jgi:hypothetical protein